jgi:hypothetical protein
LTIESRIDGGQWSQAGAIYPLQGQAVRLRAAKVPGASIRWYRIVPNIGKLYHNAEWPWNPGAYRWLGFEKIEYQRCEIETARDRWEINPFADPGNSKALAASKHYRNDLGSFWFQAEATGPGGVDASPGLGDGNERGLSPGVFRISVRESRGYLGWLTSLYNVPAVFGATAYQSRNYLGLDCAKSLMCAYDLEKGLPQDRDCNVECVIARFPVVARFHLAQGKPDKTLRWGKDIRPGDFLAVEYQGARSHQHIGAFYKDANGNGVLDPEDLVLQMGPEPLHVSTLSEGAFDGEIVVVRPP